MEHPEESLSQENPVTPACRNCGQAHALLIGKNQLCTECHHGFVKYPIPIWIKAFGWGILLVLLFSLFSLSGNFITGIHFKRGEMAYEKKNYHTAEREFAAAVKREPSYTEAKFQLLLAAYHNHDFDALAEDYKAIINQPIDDHALYDEISNTISAAASYFPSDSLRVLFGKYDNDAGRISEEEWRNYLAQNANDQYGMIALASKLFDERKLAATDSLLNLVLAADNLQYNALCLKSPLKREMGQIDSSFYYADQLLELNQEDGYALSSKSRSLLKIGKDSEALKMALRSTTLNPKDGHALGSLALAYHFLHENSKRDAIIKQAEADSSIEASMSYVKDVISGKVPFRN